MTATVRAALLADFPDLARDCGLDPLVLLRGAGLDRAVIANPGLNVPASQVAALLESAAQASGRYDFALQLAMRRNLAHLGPSGLVISQQPSLRTALAMAEHYRHLLNEVLYVGIEEAADQVLLRCSLALEGAMLSRQVSELALATTVQLARIVIGPHWSPQAVCLVHAAPPDSLTHRRFFGSPVRFGEHFNGLILTPADLDHENPQAQTQLAQQARILLDSLPPPAGRDLLAVLRSNLILLLPIGRASARAAGKAMGLSLRSLQRALDQRGTSFTAELEALRRELARRYLAEPGLSVGQIAEQLGYAGAPAFIRWFKGAFGATPQAWRRASV